MGILCSLTNYWYIGKCSLDQVYFLTSGEEQYGIMAELIWKIHSLVIRKISQWKQNEYRGEDRPLRSAFTMILPRSKDDGLISDRQTIKKCCPLHCTKFTSLLEFYLSVHIPEVEWVPDLTSNGVCVYAHLCMCLVDTFRSWVPRP